MANFCKQCSELIFGKDFGDLKGLVLTNITDAQKLEHPNVDEYIANVICEGCGFIQVNEAGECMSLDCIGEHRKTKIEIIKKILKEPDDDIEF